MVVTKLKTDTKTNTQLAVAVLAAFMAGGLAFAAAPSSKIASPLVKCSSLSVQLVSSIVNACPIRQSMSANVTCPNGESTVLRKNACQSQAQFQIAANDYCSSRQCNPQPQKLQADLALRNFRLTPQGDGSVTYHLEYINQGTLAATGPFYFSFIAQDARHLAMWLDLNQITSGQYVQEMPAGDSLGPKYDKPSFPILPLGVGVIDGIIPSDLIQQGMKSFHVKIDSRDTVAESNEQNNKISAAIPAEAIFSANQAVLRAGLPSLGRLNATSTPPEQRRPDLQIFDVVFDCATGTSHFRLDNRGTAPAPFGIPVQITWSNGDQIISDRSISLDTALNPGSSVEQTFPCPNQRSTSMKIYVDPEDRIVELDESNNLWRYEQVNDVHPGL
jgi:hypothetical protein